MDRKYWHPALCGATEWELQNNKADLVFDTEYHLSKKSLVMDLLIIRKTTRTVIENEIGKIFRRYNIVEFKGYGDSLNIDDYYKTIGYACLYKGLGKHVNEIPAEELTVTMMREAYPRELFKRLEGSGVKVTKQCDGIYYVEGDTLFPIQIIVTRELNERHSALRILTRKVKESDARRFLEETGRALEPGDKENIDAVLQVSVAANRDVYEKIREDKDMCEALRDLMKEQIEQEVEQGIKQGREQGIKQGREQGIKQGIEQGIEQGREQGEQTSTIKAIKKMMEKMKLTAQQAMDVLDISAEEQQGYLAKL